MGEGKREIGGKGRRSCISARNFFFQRGWDSSFESGLTWFKGFDSPRPKLICWIIHHGRMFMTLTNNKASVQLFCLWLHKRNLRAEVAKDKVLFWLFLPAASYEHTGQWILFTGMTILKWGRLEAREGWQQGKWGHWDQLQAHIETHHIPPWVPKLFWSNL